MTTPDSPFMLDHVRVLIVEDDVTLASMLAEIVTQQGASARVVQSIVEGRTILAHMLPDIVLLDLVLPDASGITLLTHIRRSRRTDVVPVIILSGHCIGDVRQQALDAGADYIFQKPFVVRELVSVMQQRILARRRTHPDLQSAPLPVQVGGTESDRFNRQVTMWVEQHYAQTTITVAHAARDLGVSEAVLQRRCNSYLGCSFNMYLNNWRLNLAHAYIQSGCYNMADVAYRTGFASPSYFTQRFRRRFGITPKHLSMQLRRQTAT